MVYGICLNRFQLLEKHRSHHAFLLDTPEPCYDREREVLLKVKNGYRTTDVVINPTPVSAICRIRESFCWFAPHTEREMHNQNSQGTCNMYSVVVAQLLPVQ